MMADVDPILREIDEAVQREKLQALWQLFGRYILALSVFVVVLTVSYVLWQNHREERRAALTARYLEATHLAEAGNYKEAAPAFAALRKSSEGELSALAALREAQVLAADKQPANAWKLYGEIARDTSAAPELRNLALLLAQNLAMDLPGTKGPAAAPGKAEGTVPFGYTLREQQALDAYAGGKAEEARTILTALHEEEGLTSSQRGRVGDLLTYVTEHSQVAPEGKGR